MHNTFFMIQGSASITMPPFLSSEMLADQKLKAANAAEAIRDRSIHAWRYAIGGTALLRTSSASSFMSAHTCSPVRTIPLAADATMTTAATVSLAFKRPDPPAASGNPAPIPDLHRGSQNPADDSLLDSKNESFTSTNDSNFVLTPTVLHNNSRNFQNHSVFSGDWDSMRIHPERRDAQEGSSKFSAGYHQCKTALRGKVDKTHFDVSVGSVGTSHTVDPNHAGSFESQFSNTIMLGYIGKRHNQKQQQNLS